MSNAELEFVPGEAAPGWRAPNLRMTSGVRPRRSSVRRPGAAWGFGPTGSGALRAAIRGVLFSARTAVIAVVTATVLGALASSAPASAATRVFEQPVSFQVSNVNHSRLPCATDGRSYTVRGHLVGTGRELHSERVTLYLHGLGLGEFFWRLQGVPGYDFAAGMARRGHASVVIDRLGYGSSGKPQGMGSCIGGQADIAHQIIGQLKSGRYRGAVTPRFRRVGLIGHSAGGLITEVEAYSFRDAGAIGVLAYADQGPSAFQLALAKTSAMICAAGGQLSGGTAGPTGYAKLGQTPAEAIKAFFFSAPPAVRIAALPQLTSTPCGDLASYSAAPATDIPNLPRIRVPVLAVQGARDTLFPAPDVRRQARRFTGSRSVTFETLPDAGHALTFERTHLRLEAIVASFLSRHGL